MGKLSIAELIRRPEAGAFLGMVAVFIFFTIFGSEHFASAAGAASWLNVAANLGIIAIPIGFLMIAGELDISIGAMVPAASMSMGIISWSLRSTDPGRRRTDPRLRGDRWLDQRYYCCAHSGALVDRDDGNVVCSCRS